MQHGLPAGAGKRVGVFDSGVGGLNVLAACRRLLPGTRFFYYGDNAHAPYGQRPSAQIVRFVRTAFCTFARLGVDAAVLACNTATAVCAADLRSRFLFPVIGMEPAVAPAARAGGRILVLATPCTAQSCRLQTLLRRFPACRFTVCALPRLAGAIERHFARGEPLTISDHLPAGSFDGVVLGCTHYSFFAREIAAFYGARVYDGSTGTAHRLVHVLEKERGLGEFGIDDHLRPAHNPNKCFIKKYKKEGEGGIIFLGSGRKVNKMVYFTNICFTKN